MDYTASGTIRTAIGIRSDLNAGTAFDGRIDEVRLYNHAITDGEITSLFNNPSGSRPIAPIFFP
jgi:hypothetical protein